VSDSSFQFTKRVTAPSAFGWMELSRHKEMPILAISVLATLYFALTAPNFLTTGSFATLITYIAPTAIIAIGLAPLMISGEIDVSVGKTFAFAPIVVALSDTHGAPLLVSVILAIVASGIVGALNGLLTVVTGISSFIITLATYFIVNGLNLVLTDGIPLSSPGSGWYRTIMGAGSYSQILWALCLMIVVQFMLVKTRFGMHTVAVGANPTGAAEVGVAVRRVKVFNFVLASVLAGLAGIFEAVRVTSTEPIAGGSSTTFYAIAAVVMGGTILTGGSGTAVGAFLGAYFLGSVRDGFTLSGVSAYSFDLIVGGAILVAMTVNAMVAHLGRKWGAA
jgi:simple sugar transport system permease protein